MSHMHIHILQAMDARLHAIHLLPQLCSLGGAPVTPSERLAAAGLHGVGAGALAAVRRRWFPEGELDDGGGAPAPAAAGAPAREGGAAVPCWGTRRRSALLVMHEHRRLPGEARLAVTHSLSSAAACIDAH
jgi:hypothetical protein